MTTMPTKLPDISEQLRKAVKATGMGNNEAAREFGVDKGSMSRFLKGTFDLKLTTAQRIARGLGGELAYVRLA